MATAILKPLPRALEDYLETIYLLVRDSGYARVRDIAKARGVKAGSVSPALRRLATMGLIDYERREYIGLTAAGEAQARRVLSRHQLLTRFFNEVLEMPLQGAEAQACALEHGLSDDGMDHLARFFERLHPCDGRPGHFMLGETGETPPGPREGGCEPQLAAPGEHAPAPLRLSQLEPGPRAKVQRIEAQGDQRRQLLGLGFIPAAPVTVLRHDPGTRRLWVNLLGSPLVMDMEDAASVVVEPA